MTTFVERNTENPLIHKIHVSLIVTKYADQVVVFNEDSPIELIEEIRPHIIFAGSDYHEEDVAGFAIAKVVIVPRYRNFSTSNLRTLNTSTEAANVSNQQ